MSKNLVFKTCEAKIFSVQLPLYKNLFHFKKFPGSALHITYCE